MSAQQAGTSELSISEYGTRGASSYIGGRPRRFSNLNEGNNYVLELLRSRLQSKELSFNVQSLENRI